MKGRISLSTQPVDTTSNDEIGYEKGRGEEYEKCKNIDDLQISDSVVDGLNSEKIHCKTKKENGISSPGNCPLRLHSSAQFYAYCL